MKNRVKNIVKTGIFQGWSHDNIISQIMFEIATKEELEKLSYWFDIPELKNRAEKLYKKYREKYYNKEENTMKNTCKNCKYFNTCGDLNRTEPCNGREENSYYFSEDNRESAPELMDRTFTTSQLSEVYRDIVDKAEYQTFEDWLIDMLRTGLVYRK